MCRNRSTFLIFLMAVTLNGTACSRAPEAIATPPAEPAYFTGYQLQPPPVSSSQVLVKVSLCPAPEPTDLAINVYSFGPDTNADDALDQVMRPGSTPITPTEVTVVQAKYTDSAGTLISSYDQQAQFRVALDRNAVSVLTTRTADGKLWSGWVITTSQLVGDVCLSRVPDRGGRVGISTHQRPQPGVSNYAFSIVGIEDRRKLTPRLCAEVWFVDADQTDQAIRQHWTDTRTGEIDTTAEQPAHIAFDITASDYDTSQVFRLATELPGKLVVLWHFVEARLQAAQRYRMQLGIYPPAPDEQEQRYTLLVDQFRAGL